MTLVSRCRATLLPVIEAFIADAMAGHRLGAVIATSPGCGGELSYIMWSFPTKGSLVISCALWSQ